MFIKDILKEQKVWLRPGMLRGSFTPNQLRELGFSQAQNGAWFISRARWEQLLRDRKIY